MFGFTQKTRPALSWIGWLPWFLLACPSSALSSLSKYRFCEFCNWKKCRYSICGLQCHLLHRLNQEKVQDLHQTVLAVHHGPGVVRLCGRTHLLTHTYQPAFTSEPDV